MAQTEHQAAIEALLKEAKGPLSADEIRSELGLRKISQATVYRVLKKSTEEGLFREVSFANSPNRYEMACLEHHHHFMCVKCDRVFDLEGCPKQIVKLAPENFEVLEHEVLLKGHCSSCRLGA